MVKKKMTKRTRPKDDEDEEDVGAQLNPETRRGIVIVVFFLLAVVTALSLFDLAGAFGQFLNTVMENLFGWGKVATPFLFAFLGIVLLLPEKIPMRASNYVGLALLVFTYSAILHLWIDLGDALVAVPEGRGGGYLGYALSFPFQKIMGFWASLVVLIALLIISILVLFNTSLEQILRRRGIRMGFIGWIRGLFRRSDDEEKEDDVEEATEPEETGEEKREEEIEAGPKLKTKPILSRQPRRKIDLPVDLLERQNAKPQSGDIRLQSERIQSTLENFGIHVEMGEVKVGPTVTQYTLRPAEGVKLSQIIGLANDLALALAAHPIRIEAPIPGKSLVGIEVPNETVAIVGLRDVLESGTFKKRKSNLSIAIGQDVSGKAFTADLDTMPHLLIAGATGSGKSVAINSLIVSFLYQNNPDDLKFILIDPKKVELTAYDGIPHLLTPVITDVDKTINALKWLVGEMDRRYHLLSDSGKKNIHLYNKSVLMKLPFIVVIIDELADIMNIAAQDVERVIIRLAQMARAVGIHLVLSTQRPSVDVITGLIKANITSRIAFSVASLMDSRTILDYSGAEKLLGRGDMLFSTAEQSKPRRIQGAFVSEEEIEHVVNHIKKQAKPEYNEEITEKQTTSSVDASGEYGDDDLLDEAKEIIWSVKKASASMLQRHLRIGYARAARILDILEEQGIIGPGEGAKPREIILRKEDLFEDDSKASEESNDNTEEESGEEDDTDFDNGDSNEDIEADAEDDEKDGNRDIR